MGVALLVILMILVALVIVAVWWKPSKAKSISSAVSDYLPVQAVAVRPEPVKAERDAVLEEEIDIIASLIREEERERRRQAALDRLAAVKAKAAESK